MSKFTPTEIDALLNAKGTLPHEADIPANFFEDMEERILTATTGRQTQSHTFARKKWFAVTATAMLLLVCAITLQNVQRIASPTTLSGGIYAASDNTSDDDLYDLNELYDADLFLAEI